jgi:MSHA biogenesis protein MshN
MSIINTMLRDLDQRKARSAPGVAAGVGVRATKPSPRMRMPPVSRQVLAALAVLAGVAAWWVPQRFASATIPAPARLQPPIAAAVPAERAAPPAVREPAANAPAPMARDESATAAAPREAPKRAAAAHDDPGPSVTTAMLSPARSKPLAGTLEMPAPEGNAGKGSSPGAAAAPAKTYSPAQMSAKWVGDAVLLEGQGRQEEARALLQRALAADPSDVTPREMLVRLHVDAGGLQDARVLLEEGLRLHPQHAPFALSLARMRAEAGDAAGAIRVLESVRAAAGDDPGYRATLAALLLNAKRYDEAAQHYLVALRADPANAACLVGIGVAWENMGRPADALQAYRRAETAPRLEPEVASFVAERLVRLGSVERPVEVDGVGIARETHR